MSDREGIEVIRALDPETELGHGAFVIRESFADVAAEFGLTRENCPTHPSFQPVEGLRRMSERGLELYGLFECGEQLGFVAVEDAGDGLYYLERLAVLPEHRHNGRGRALVEFVEKRVRGLGGERVSVAIIAGSAVLMRWYEDLGFRETETREIPSLPFDVCFMEKAVGPESPAGNIL